MCDESDVENSLKSLLSGYVYPNGTGQTSAVGVPIQIARGWPKTQDFSYAKAQSGPKMPGLVLISVCTRGGIERNTTRVPLTWSPLTLPVHTVTVAVAVNQITIGGTVSVPQNVIAIIGGPYGAQTFSYAVQATDTLTSIATGLAALIADDFPGTTSSGPVVTVNSPLNVEARVASAGTAVQVVGQQNKEFQITIWAPPSNVTGQDADNWRNAVAKIITPPLRQLTRLAMVDGVWATVRFERTVTIDQAQAQGLYRRDLLIWVEYSTTVVQTFNEVGVAVGQLQGAQGDLPLPADLPTVTTNS